MLGVIILVLCLVGLCYCLYQCEAAAAEQRREDRRLRIAWEAEQKDAAWKAEARRLRELGHQLCQAHGAVSVSATGESEPLPATTPTPARGSATGESEPWHPLHFRQAAVPATTPTPARVQAQGDECPTLLERRTDPAKPA